MYDTSCIGVLWDLFTPTFTRNAMGSQGGSTRFLSLPDVYLAIHMIHSPPTGHSGCTNDVILTQCGVRGFVGGAGRPPATLTNAPTAPSQAMPD